MENFLIELFGSVPEGKVHNPISAQTLQNETLILYGAGGGFQTFINFVVKTYDLKVDFVIDKKFKEETYYYGYRAIPSESYQPTEEDKNKTVVVTVTRPEFENEILDYLEGKGFRKVILAKHIYEFSLPVLPQEMFNDWTGYFVKNKTKILRAYELLQDDLSKEIFRRFVATHYLRTSFYFPHDVSSNQYFPSDVPLRKGYYKHIVHCGAYIGDTVNELTKKFGKIETLVLFEPNLKSFSTLINYLKANKDSIAKNIVAFPCAVWNKTTQLGFLTAGMESTVKIDKGDTYVQGVALNDVLVELPVTYITMDVEGAELEALHGAVDILKDKKPDLAITVYHQPNHIWEIPLFLQSVNKNYKFYLRNYRGFPIETILYATLDE